MVVQEAADSPRRWCFGCGDVNPEGLKIQFDVEGKTVHGRFVARKVHQGYPGIAHGGIAAAVLDEAMGWAQYAAGAWAMTAKMEVRYRRPLPLDQELAIRAEVTRDRGRRIEVAGDIRDGSGALLASARGLFLRMPPERARDMDAFYLGRISGQAPRASP
jgi:uncharacterized protein (TIGR00369 family)